MNEKCKKITWITIYKTNYDKLNRFSQNLKRIKEESR